MNKYCIIVALYVAFCLRSVHSSEYIEDDLDHEDEEDEEDCDWCKNAVPGKKIAAEEVEACFDGDRGGLTFMYDPKTDIHLLANETAGTATILDFVHGITYLHNTNTGYGFVLNYGIGKSFFFNQETNITRDDSETNLHKYLTERSPQQFYEYARKHGTAFTPKSIAPNIAGEMQEILDSLNKETPYPSCDSLDTILRRHKTTSNYFRSSMDGFLELMTAAHTPIPGDLSWLLKFYQALAYFLSNFDEGIDTLLDREVKLDLGELLSQKSGFHVLGHIIRSFVGHFDVGIVLSRHLSSVNRIFSLVDTLGGQYGNGFDGYVHVMAEMTRFIANKTSVKEMEDVLVGYCTNPATSSIVVGDNWMGGVGAVLKVIDDSHLGSNLPFLNIVLERVRDDEWNCGNVSATEISEMVMELEAPCDRIRIEEILNLARYVHCDDEFLCIC